MTKRVCAVCKASLKGKKVGDQYYTRLICQACHASYTFAPDGKIVRGHWEFIPGTYCRTLVRDL